MNRYLTVTINVEKWSKNKLGAFIDELWDDGLSIMEWGDVIRENNTNKSMLDEYSTQMGLVEPMTLEQLLDSLDELHEVNKDIQEYRRGAFAQGIAEGYAHGVKQVTSEYIKIDDLKKMTLQEIAQMICEVEQ